MTALDQAFIKAFTQQSTPTVTALPQPAAPVAERLPVRSEQRRIDGATSKKECPPENAYRAEEKGDDRESIVAASATLDGVLAAFERPPRATASLNAGGPAEGIRRRAEEDALGQWTVDSEQWTVGAEQWVLGTQQWAVGSEPWAVGAEQHYPAPEPRVPSQVGAASAVAATIAPPQPLENPMPDARTTVKPAHAEIPLPQQLESPPQQLEMASQHIETMPQLGDLAAARQEGAAAASQSGR